MIRYLLLFSLVTLFGCHSKDKDRDRQVTPQAFRLGDEAFEISGQLNQGPTAIEGTGALLSLEQLQTEGGNTFELEFSLPSAQSAVVLYLYSRPGLTDGLNIRFYGKDGQLETFSDYSDGHREITSVLQALGPYTTGEKIKLQLSVELSDALAPQIETSYSLSGVEQRSRFEFKANAAPFLPLYSNWSGYLVDAKLYLLNH